MTQHSTAWILFYRFLQVRHNTGFVSTIDA